MTTGLLVLSGALAATAVLAFAHGRLTRRGVAPRSAERLTEADLGTALGTEASYLQFSSAFCAPCRATRARLRAEAADAEQLGYIEIDAESRLDLVRRLNVLRTPTVFVLDADGRVVWRWNGPVSGPEDLERLRRAVGLT